MAAASRDNPLDGMQQIGFGRAFRDELCDMLERVPMLRGFSRKELEQLSDFMHAYEAPPGATILEEGKRSNFLCFLTEGRLEVLKRNESGHQRKLAVIRPGKSVGEMSLIDELPHSASVIAAERAVLAVLTKMNLERIRDEHPRLAFELLWRIAQLMSHRLRQTSGVLIDFLGSREA